MASPITLMCNDLLLYLSNFLAVRDIGALAATCKRFFPILNEQLYFVDVKSGRCHSLGWACLHGLQPILEKSLEVGASINRTFGPFKFNEDLLTTPWYDDIDGKTPLYIAVQNNHLQVVQCLLAKKADITLLCTYDHTLLEALCRQNPSCDSLHFLGILKALLCSGVDFNLPIRFINTDHPDYHPLLYMFRDSKDNLGAIRLLLEHGVVTLNDQSRPGDELWTKTLIEHIDVDRWFPPENEVLLPEEDLLPEKLDILLKFHPSILRTEGLRVLLYKILYNPHHRSKSLLEVLLRHGWDPNTKCIYELWGRLSTEIEYHVPVDVIIGSITLLWDVREFEEEGYAQDMLGMLLRAGADANLDNDIEDNDELGYRPPSPILRLVDHIYSCTLPTNIDHLYNSAILLLLRHGACPNTPCEVTGRTALHILCGDQYLYEDRIQLLLEYGADPNARDHNGRTPLQVLYCDGWPTTKGAKMIELLLQHGGDRSQVSSTSKGEGTVEGDYTMAVPEASMPFERSRRDAYWVTDGYYMPTVRKGYLSY